MFCEKFSTRCHIWGYFAIFHEYCINTPQSPLDAHTRRDPGGRSANFTLLETTSDSGFSHLKYPGTPQKQTESGLQKEEKHAGQATRDWREAQGKTLHIPTAQQRSPPKIKIEHIYQAKIPGKRQQLACEPEQEPTLEAVEEEVEA